MSFRLHESTHLRSCARHPSTAQTHPPSSSPCRRGSSVNHRGARPHRSASVGSCTDASWSQRHAEYLARRVSMSAQPSARGIAKQRAASISHTDSGSSTTTTPRSTDHEADLECGVDRGDARTVLSHEAVCARARADLRTALQMVSSRTPRAGCESVNGDGVIDTEPSDEELVAAVRYIAGGGT